MKIVRTDNTSMTVMGLDLVYSVPDVISSQGTKVLTIIPCNPAYWVGTRVSTLALGYQQYRPLKFDIHYVPIVSALQPGNIFGGTIWSDITIPDENIQQSLVTSQGGMSTQVSQPKSSSVRCKSNLTYNLYNIGGDLNNESNPFYYVAISVANFNDNNQRITPGYFWISYSYVFKNPIGNNTVFKNLGIQPFKDLSYHLNTTALLTEPFQYEKRTGNKIVTRTLPTFTKLDLNTDEIGEIICYYNDDVIPLGENSKLWVFQNYSNEPGYEEDSALKFTIYPPLETPKIDESFILRPQEKCLLFQTTDNKPQALFILNNNDDDYLFSSLNRLCWLMDTTSIGQMSGLTSSACYYLEESSSFRILFTDSSKQEITVMFGDKCYPLSDFSNSIKSPHKQVENKVMLKEVNKGLSPEEIVDFNFKVNELNDK